MAALVAGGCSASGHVSGGLGSVGTTGSTAPGASTPSGSGQQGTAPPTTAQSFGAGNPWFPLIDGATWVYVDAGGPEGTQTITNHIVSITRSASATTVDVDISVGSRVLPVQYQVDRNGNVHMQLSSGSMGVSGNSGSSLIIPNANDIVACHPCRFTANFTASSPLAGASAMSFQLAETVNSAGQTPIQDTYTGITYTGAQLLHTTIDVTPAAGGPPFQVDSTSDVYLAQGIGIVQEGGGSATESIAGTTHSFPTGTLYLKSYTP